MSRCTVFDDTESWLARELVFGCRPSLISWWIVWRRRHRGRSLNAPSRPTARFSSARAAGATAATKCLRCAARHARGCPWRAAHPNLSVCGPVAWLFGARGPPVADPEVTMQIPYDLEFVENRPVVGAKAIALPEHPAAWLGAGRPGADDAFDALLRWAHRLLRRMESTRPGR